MSFSKGGQVTGTIEVQANAAVAGGLEFGVMYALDGAMLNIAN